MKPLLVIGDVMLDRYTYGTADRLSPEAPVPIVRQERHEISLGGAGNAAANIASLGGEVYLLGVIGDDKDGDKVDEICNRFGIRDSLYRSKDRSTIVKQRIIANGYQIARLDVEGDNLPCEIEQHYLRTWFLDCLNNISAVVVSDYAKGVITRDLMFLILEMTSTKKIPVFIDPKVEHKDLYYKHFYCMTPNVRELEGLSGMKDNLNEAAERLSQEYQCDYMLVTEGEKGMTIVSPNGFSHNIASTAKKVFDVSGAGDTVIATLALMTAMGLDMVDAAEIANIAAGIVVGKPGTDTVTVEELWQEIPTDSGLMQRWMEAESKV